MPVELLRAVAVATKRPRMRPQQNTGSVPVPPLAAMTTPSHRDPSPADPEFVAWAAEHQRENRLHEAELAQITEHPDPDGEGDAIGEQEAWARRHDHEKRLHESAIEQMKPH